MSTSPDRSRSSFNGYHLLNEVSTGGTLSSLFSILSLFTEDIKLSWSPAAEAASDDEEYGDEAADTTIRDDPSGLMFDLKRPKSRANSDVSQLGDAMLGRTVTSPDRQASSTGTKSPFAANGKRRLKRSSSVGMSQSTEKDRSHSPPEGTPVNISASLPATSSPSPVLQPLNDVHADTMASSTPISPELSRAASNLSVPTRGNGTKRVSPKPPHGNTGSMAFKGTIARATTDTTLAVIPAEAFKKLTRKFPKASGTVVQVVLERFSRVTFMTGK